MSEQKVVEVKTSIGDFELRKPKAGPRNRAMTKAEIHSGDVKLSILTQELLPKCVSKRPENIDSTVPMEQILDDLEIEDYDKLSSALMDLLNEHETEEKKEEKEEISGTS